MDRQALREKVYAISKRVSLEGDIFATLCIEDKAVTYIVVRVNDDPLENNDLLFGATLDLVTSSWSYEQDMTKFFEQMNEDELSFIKTLDELAQEQAYQKYIDHVLFRLDTHYRKVQGCIKIKLS